MFFRLARFFALVALLQVAGGYSLALQSAAWLGMLAQYTRVEGSVFAGLEKTFDGAHPCRLCKAVQKVRGEEEKQPPVNVVVKLDAILSPAWQLPEPRTAPWSYPAGRLAPPARTCAPPTPPPQRA